MAFRSKETMKKLVKNLGGEKNLPARAKERLEKLPPKTTVVMGRAHRGLYAGRHIQFGNQVSEDGGNKTRRNWKPNVQGKRLFSYILDRFIRVKVTTHALRCIDKAGGLDEYLLKTPYHKMDAEFGLFWKAKVEKLYEELGEKKVFTSLEDESKIKEKFKELKLVEKAHCKEARLKMYDWILKSEKIEEGGDTPEATNNEASTTREALASDTDFHKQMVANA
ncbi:PREDICTED: 54S ribosomal protein L24, mitochondrial [Ipomoea nil]|uniref:54S ribosomal protein L24, mitochondrial n=1 Tax=Ipomoea nil TaxID=35883 RepID=UPI000900BB37|nr:PREDICTED: 54S ribosomal protein L24, mitochondrial [Ipomoea nil]XP_019177625.1 PREDICTED: 54S ribosomal protein L24, mitochondrial [Ipomoea nil]XP_019177626.1 PREDICTED: 54S ribosomal protein L24, mitochondrial [Ipomoea nil]